MKKLNRFYIGADHIARSIETGKNDPWTKSTLLEAIKHAEKVLDDEDRNVVVVVQIVRIVRRRKAPIVIEKV